MIYVATVAIPEHIPPYTVHQYLYGYFPQHPPDGHRPFLFRRAGPRCLLVSRIRPACPHTELTLDLGRAYPFEAALVPTQKFRDAGGKLQERPLAENRERRDWLKNVCGRFGGSVGHCHWFNRERLQFRHGNGHLITLQPAQAKGMIVITDNAAFSEMLLRGVGRGKAFGYGLLVFPELMFGDGGA